MTIDLFNRRVLALLGSVSMGALVSSASWGANEFLELGDLADGSVFSRAKSMSADGSVVVGGSYSADGYEAFHWTVGGGLVGLGDLTGGETYSYARGISGNGLVVVGESSSTDGLEAFRWTAGGGMVGLGDLAGGDFESGANGADSTGAVIVGFGTSADGTEAFRWTSGGGMIGLGDLAGGDHSSSAYRTDASGNVVVGFGTTDDGWEAFRWTQADGMVGLGFLGGAGYESLARGISADGSTIVGWSETASGFEAFSWTSGSGMVGLGELSGGGFFSVAHDASADGSVIVGYSHSDSGYEAVRWLVDPADGPRLQTVEHLLAGDGIDLGNWYLLEATAVSDDGTIIAGYGVNPGGDYEAWRAVAEIGFVSVSEFATSLAAMGGLAASALAHTQQNLDMSLDVARHYGSRGGRSNAQASFIPWSKLRFASLDLDALSLADNEQGARHNAWAMTGFATSDTKGSEADDLIGSFGTSWQVASDLRIGAGFHIGENEVQLASNGSSSDRSAYGFNGFIAIEPVEIPVRIYVSLETTSLEDDVVRYYLNGVEPVTSAGRRDGSTVGGAFFVGWDFPAADDVKFTPFVEFDVTQVRFDAYTEQNGPFPATFDSIKDTAKVFKLGIEVSRPFKPGVSGWASLALAHQIDDQLPGVSGSVAQLSSDFAWTGGTLEQNRAEARFGLSGRIDDRATLKASGVAIFDADGDAGLGATIGFSVSF